MAKKTPRVKSTPNLKTVECGCGAILSVSKLKAQATQDILPENKPERTEGLQQFSSDCPLCGAKRVYVERRK